MDEMLHSRIDMFRVENRTLDRLDLLCLAAEIRVDYNVSVAVHKRCQSTIVSHRQG